LGKFLRKIKKNISSFLSCLLCDHDNPIIKLYFILRIAIVVYSSYSICTTCGLVLYVDLCRMDIPNHGGVSDYSRSMFVVLLVYIDLYTGCQLTN
jgi:hypothetical protein